MSGPRFFDYHLLLDERADQILAMTDDIAERVRKIGRTTIQLQRIADNEPFVDFEDIRGEVCEDEKGLAVKMLQAHVLCHD
jgi:starvation-inducible DNA-binding protein